MTLENTYKDQDQINNIEVWFDEMVANLRYDQTLFDNDIIGEEKKKIYSAMINGDSDFVHSYARRTSSTHFISNIIDSYFKELLKSKSKPKSLALELSNSKILVWAEIKEDDELMEDTLILAEAKINAEYSKYGFHISSTIVEDCDNFTIPARYKEITIAS
ncbi:hypothetical protein CSC81_09865 [Tenacibaculum discolor]|uniref:Uncharacterized protein n=1 Tax=Tenacibaculum discolor TaxID=361581 RepID=A0A2G1BTM1_9FLAO|nr:hypothetical protein [Tenacibaculum discolor]MDP2541614.1 hypothetical protein [Tenacibaculum discolor]PHN97376.1 hypothetical protein CSC81_09865 [Tenacibaculum discolor]PHO00669.1 hypothetical protein CSC82_27645 [Rhodobacteraceae bacterium 4F10]